MPWQLPAAMALFLSLAVILHHGSQVRATGFPEITGSSQPTRAATVQATAKPSFLKRTSQVPHTSTAASSTGGHVSSQTAATTSNSETPTTDTTIKTLTTTSLLTTNSTPSTSPKIHTPVTTLATPNNSHTAAPVTEATIGPSTAPGSLPPTITPPAHTTRPNPSTVSHTTGKTTQPSSQTTLPATLSTSPHLNTTSQKPTQPTHALVTTTAVHNATHTASPATIAPGPTLAPQPSPAKTGIYQVLNGSRLCIKAEMGIQLMVQDTESVFSPQRYFNIDPNATQASGNCGFRNSNLLLNFQGGFVNLTFTKDENSYYISEVGAYLTISNPEKIYQGMKSSAMMFETVIGHSFKCVTEQSIQLSAHLQLKTMNVQLQAFDFEDDHFGNVDECSSDYTIVLPVIGAIVLGLCAVGLIVYGIRLRRESSGYQRI
ncbi:lysosome-associated membrane glycoprotein 3 isoform X2 [Myotis myotis]|uniref:Lysosome-associated membrane glycoprotein 3 n=1 Tax=Myotis myotis TaxID=51298 RepID=A0A7J7ZWC4_MYOMY|nr:lysosome-associated membrane glycoprotein 3 isoform X2 [Myotis myotis]KAF6378602.1 lysosomal associated membrane protein 3 [Myotis myotis]